MKAVVISVIFMFLYIWFRFWNFWFVSSAVLALVYVYSYCAGLLYIIQFLGGQHIHSCHNVDLWLLDQFQWCHIWPVPENLSIMKVSNLKLIVHTSVTQIFTRSIYFSLTTFIKIFILYLLDIPSVSDLSFWTSWEFSCEPIILYAWPTLCGILWRRSWEKEDHR